MRNKLLFLYDVLIDILLITLLVYGVYSESPICILLFALFVPMLISLYLLEDKSGGKENVTTHSNIHGNH